MPRTTAEARAIETQQAKQAAEAAIVKLAEIKARTSDSPDAVKLAAVVEAVLESHPNDNGQCGGICQDTYYWEWPCHIVQVVTETLAE